MSDSLDAIRKAQEDRFFKLEQEKHLQAYVKKLKASGRFDQIPASAPRTFSASALPQVLAHELRLSTPVEEVLERRQLDRSFMTRQIIKGVCTGDPYLINSVTLGSRVSMGKNKWSAGTNTGIENTTIFSVHKAQDLMAETPKHLNGIESRAAKHMVDNSFVEIGGKRIKLMPDPTPGRAMAWGGTLAIWGTAALAVGTCKPRPNRGARAMATRTPAFALVSLVLLSLATSSLGFEEERLPGWQGEVARVGTDAGSGSRLRGGDRAGEGSGADTGGLPVVGSIHTDRSRIVKLSEKPKAYLYRGFLRQAECDYIKERAKPKLEKSTVVDNKTGQSVPSNIRTSDGMFFDRHEDDIIEDIERRIAEWTNVPWENGEGIQVLRYEVGQKYEPHLDAFSDKFNTEESKGGQRMATVLMYLSDVEEGGETVFPRSVDKPHKGDPKWSECAQRGVAVKARKGDALLFWSLDIDSNVDELSLHGGCPVIKGTKWSATKWMHLKSFDTANSFKFPEGVCDDVNEQCEGWASTGECEKNPKYMIGNGKTDGYCVRACGKCPPGSKRKETVDMSKFLKDPEGIKNGVAVDIATILSRTDKPETKLIGVDNSYADLAKYLED